MKSFKHSGTFGDLIYSLPVVKFLGGGKFFLHLHQIDWVVQHYYGGGQPDPYHRGRMTEADFLSLKDLMLAQDYIESFEILDPKSTEISHNLDRFREPFKHHPGNYVNIYAELFRIPFEEFKNLRNEPWLTVPEPTIIPGKTVIINRTGRWTSSTARESYDMIKSQGAEADSIFIGHENEYLQFKQDMAWDIPYHKTHTLLEMAKVIAGADQFIGNQSVALALAIGLGTEFACELRSDLPIERNECWFPEHPKGDYF